MTGVVNKSSEQLVNLSYLKSFCLPTSLFPKSHYQRTGFVLVITLMHMGQHSQVPAAITALQKTVVFPTNIRQQKPCVLQKSNPWNSQGQPSSHHQFPGKVRLRLEVSEGQGTRGSGMTGSHSPTSEKAAEANDASVGPRSKGNRSGMLRMLPTVI